ncbi:hypothetical protein ACFYXS_02720 [Streptomyces sp. NPDC002574]|uniref:hypothetical protein n=1 Tax=Streptomyces sp. NPDC002574 TaxID=3364652 RepID=UPI00369DFBA2
MTDTELEHTSKAVWAYLRAVSDPQAVRPVAEVLGMARGTVMRAMTALEAKGLIRRVNGVWVSEETS